MRQTILNYAMVLMMAVLTVTTANAQKTMDVSKFTRMDNDLMARVTKPVRDTDEGKLCALIRVVTPLTDLEVRADALGIVQQEKHTGELWLYVPYGAKSLSFSHEGYFPLLYQYALPIEEGTVYELDLASFDTNSEAMQHNANTQLFVLTHSPEDATVFIDGVEVPSEFGVFAAMMSKGEHSYKVSADQYADAEGDFNLQDQTVRKTTTLAPLFGTFQIFTLPDNGFNISINGEKAGVSPFKSDKMEPGSYRVRIEKEKYYAVDTLIRVREGVDKELTIKLTSREDSLFYDRVMGGRDISFGVNVGYLIPTVSSTSSSMFTGSPINYSLGDERENVSYSSKTGFTIGGIVDIRLYKNFYLKTGLNYIMYKYSNKFNEPLQQAIVFANEDQVWKGDVENNYNEDYTLQLIELPVMASYRYVLTKKSSMHINVGPYISYGLSAKMKTSGTSESNGSIYSRYGAFVSSTTYEKYSNYRTHMNADFDLYSKKYVFSVVKEGGIGQGSSEQYTSDASPYKRLNFGLKAGLTYELRGFQLSLGYNLQLTNMGQNKFWEGPRIPIINGQTADNNMSGYKHRIHSFEIKLGYIFRN